ncbi:MAG: phosphoenolpyruvate--protein phosphotransferase [Roseburia sp.]|nr:phosphoenolpyruvate--protein phosphotransferase [Roseburia sp.]
MEKVTGKAVGAGIAIGKIWFYRKEGQRIERIHAADTAAEVRRYEAAREEAVRQLNVLYERAAEAAGQDAAEMFAAHAVMAQDSELAEAVRSIIETRQANAEYAVAAAGEQFSRLFAEMDDEYLRARAADVKDVSERIVNVLRGAECRLDIGEEPVIVVAEELTPSETIRLDKGKLLALVTRCGSANSHTAILARTMNIPAIVGVDIKAEWDGRSAVADGDSGTLYIEPEEETLIQMEQRQQEAESARRQLGQLKGRADVTLDGREIRLYANISGVRDVERVLANDAAGIGLFRSEFLYLEAEDYPSEESQFQAYKAVAERMAGKRVVVRTLDIGADKQIGYFHLGHEENPAMGYRAIRICLDRVDIFRTQLRALLRASAYGNIAVLYPMIISVEEVRRAKEIAASVRQELAEQGIPVGEVEQGLMIETPAAVMISDLLAEEADFLSIGTNDLTQYALAIDRQNPRLEAFYDAHHPAVLRMIQMTVENGHRHGCRVGICGELAADLSLTEDFVGMGVDELSVPPALILPLRQRIRGMGESDSVAVL